MHILNVGDVVHVVGETQHMSVHEIIDDNINDIIVVCYWFKKDSAKLQKAKVPLRLLRLSQMQED